MSERYPLSLVITKQIYTSFFEGECGCVCVCQCYVGGIRPCMEVPFQGPFTEGSTHTVSSERFD